MLRWCKMLETPSQLVVGINSDASVKLLKGQERPIIREHERCEIVLACRYVDDVVLFHEEHPEVLIRKLRPQILVKGVDHDIVNGAGCEFVMNDGGKIVRYPHRHASTTEIIQQIMETYG